MSRFGLCSQAGEAHVLLFHACCSSLASMRMTKMAHSGSTRWDGFRCALWYWSDARVPDYGVLCVLLIGVLYILWC